MVSQDVVLFNDSIGANIAYGARRNASTSELKQAAKAAHLLELIEDLPEGFDTMIGERGVRLSGGQRQRLAIARAILKDAPILILDEATSALDSESERYVQNALEDLMQGRTTLVIAHRLSTIERADRIAVLDRGRLIEIGNHPSLLAANGMYANLYRIQFAHDREQHPRRTAGRLGRFMKILHTESSCGWGGQEIRILSEARGMRERGYEVLLVCPGEARIFTEAARFDVPAEALPIARKGIAGVLALRKFLNSQRAVPIDVVNSHSSTDSWLAALACRSLSARPALVRTRHVSAPVPNNFTSRWLYRVASDVVVTTGESLRMQLIDDNRLDPRRVVSVPTGIDLGQYVPADTEARAAARAALGIAPASYVVGVVATLRSWKGHRYLIDAFVELSRSMPAQPMQLLIVGDGPQREALEQQIEELAGPVPITMCGNQNDVTRYLHALDVFALPSYANEGVPQALLQAMACGVPVITTDAGAIGEIARAGDTALVVAKQDVAALRGALGETLSNRAAAAVRAERALRVVQSRHSLDAMLDQMAVIFDKSLQAGLMRNVAT